MKVASWNVNSLRARLSHVLDWIDSARPDVLGLQETKLRDENFPVEDFEARGYRCAFSGQPAYNGVALLSRLPMTDAVTDFDGSEDPQRRVLGATIGSLRVLNLYVPNGQRVGSDKYLYKLGWLAVLRRHLESELARHQRVVVLGDFNIAPEDRDVHDPVAWEGKVLCSPRERSALAAILALGFADTYRLFDQPERGYSWWDYRAAAFRRNLGLRIDLILASTTLCDECTRSTIDAAPRRRERPSDHAPIYAEFAVGA